MLVVCKALFAVWSHQFKSCLNLVFSSAVRGFEALMEEKKEADHKGSASR
jgi:hypothetical protein